MLFSLCCLQALTHIHKEASLYESALHSTVTTSPQPWKDVAKIKQTNVIPVSSLRLPKHCLSICRITGLLAICTVWQTKNGKLLRRIIHALLLLFYCSFGEFWLRSKQINGRILQKIRAQGSCGFSEKW